MKKITFYLLIVTIVFTSLTSLSKNIYSSPFIESTFEFTNYLDNYVSLKPNDSALPIADANCQNITVYLDASGNASILASDINIGSVGDGFSIDISTFSCSDIGLPVDVTLTVTDSSDGSSDTCTAQITVLDSNNPTITLNGLAIISVEACSSYTEQGAIANDNCSVTAPIAIDASAVNMNVP
ncbi:hypothetical protein, partial [Formosa maritima]